MTRRAAAAYAGFSKATLYRMLDNDPDETLVTAMERAEGEAEGAYTKIVADAAPKSWQAAAWWLERRRYQDFARRDKVEMSIDLRTVSERVAEESGLDADAILAEAEAVLTNSR
jgi:hypothetical protein